MRKILLLSFLFTATIAMGQQETYKFRISLRDKAQTTYSLSHPEKFLSQKALDRRSKQHLSVDSTDLPVCASYIKAIRQKGVRIVAVGKWENFVTIACNDSSVVAEIARLPFVKSTKHVWTKPKAQPNPKRAELANKNARWDDVYGRGLTQIKLNNGQKLHEAGFKGKGMTIAVIDGGYNNLDKITQLDNLNILGIKDFVGASNDIYAENFHGTMVLSTMASNQPNYMIGTAPEASYWLFRSEDAYSEQSVEEDYWCEAIEYADSVGADLANSSLGYFAFDNNKGSYTYRDLNGKTALISREASRVADKGMILCCSAGNSGADSWKKISVPADADNILTVGAVKEDAVLAVFSSIGNSADNRVKPDVVAMGQDATVMATSGNWAKANGTSFSSPILCGQVACLWQACPELTAKEIIQLVRESANRYQCPDNIYGYGLPDMWKAYQKARGNN